jgi:peptide/nickel transport system substrate-binding protein
MNKEQFKIINVIIMIIIIVITMTSCQYYDDYNLNNNRNTNYVFFSNINKNEDPVLDMGPVKGGTLRIFSTYPDTLNPILTNNIYVNSFSSFIFESLVRIDKKQKAEPLLSDEWDVSNDGLVWTFHIRDNVFWHDKKHFTAYDVEYTVELILKNSVFSPFKHNLQNITTFAAIDDEHFRIVLNKPNSFTAELMTFPILPKHRSKNQDSLLLSKDFFPIGTGPFKFAYTEKDSKIILKSNTSWWYSQNRANSKENEKELPYIDQIHIELYDNSKYSTGTFQTRSVDIIFYDTIDYDKYYGRYDLTIKKYTGNRFEFISFNNNNPILSDTRVRQAISYCVDKEKLIEKLFSGKAVAADIPVIPGTWLYDTNIISHDPNQTYAISLLEEAGWKDDNNIMLKKINGIWTPLKLELLVNEDNKFRVLIANEIKEQLINIGVDVEVNAVSWDKLISKVDKKDYDMAIVGCTVPSIPDISFLYSTPYISYHSSPEAERGRNIAGYKNPDIDKYIERIFAEIDDDRKKALFINMRNIIMEDVPYLGLLFYNNAVLMNRNISGNIQPHAWNKFNNIERWYLPETIAK